MPVFWNTSSAVIAQSVPLVATSVPNNNAHSRVIFIVAPPWEMNHAWRQEP
jgi:hypothetical protein